MIQKPGDDAAMHHASVGIADDLARIGQADGGFAGREFGDLHAGAVHEDDLDAQRAQHGEIEQDIGEVGRGDKGAAAGC